MCWTGSQGGVISYGNTVLIDQTLIFATGASLLQQHFLRLGRVIQRGTNEASSDLGIVDSGVDGTLDTSNCTL